MKIRILSIFTVLLNLYLIFGETCKDIKTFMSDNEIPIPAKNNCCFNNNDFKEPPYILTECDEKNKITKFIIHMKNNEKTDLNTSHFPELTELKILNFNNVNFKDKNILPEILRKIKFHNTKSGNTIYIDNSNIEDISIPSNLNIEALAVLNSNLKIVTELPSSLNLIDFTGNKLTNFDVNMIKNVKQMSLKNNNPISDTLFESITKVLKQLELLVLKNCGITRIPKTINNLSNLKSLNLNNNSIDVLPNELFELENIETLRIKENTKNLRGEFNFKHKLNCIFNVNFLCTHNINEQFCINDNIRILNECTKEYLNSLKIMLDNIYDNDNEKDQPENIQPPKPKPKSSNLPIYIALIIALVLVISFAVFFFKYKYNKQDPLIIKDENNNATYAYKMSDKSKQIVKEFQLNKDKENKEQNIETVVNSRNSNVNINVDSLDMNNNDINSSNNNTQTNHTSQVIGNTSYESINNLAGSTLSININNNISPQNMIYEFNGTSSSMSIMNDNFSNENFDEAPPYTATTSLVESKQLLQDANDLMNKEELRLQAKIQNELLATKENLLEKKIKEDKYNDKFDGEEPPPYC